MLGVVITIIISLTAFGAVYAYQREQADTGNDISVSTPQRFMYGPGYEDCPYYSEGGNEDCLREQERIQENKRLRDGDCENCEENEYQYQYRNENQYQQNGFEGCGQRNHFNNSNGNGRYGR